MNEVTKLILPLLNDEITYEDLDSSTGFINAYTEDSNRPFLENHIFLMYKSSAPNALKRFLKFKNSKNLHSTRYMVHNKEHYTVYAFPIIENKKDIRNIIKGYDITNVDNKLKIYNFWKNHEVDNLKDRIFDNHFEILPAIEEIIPEEDYFE